MDNEVRAKQFMPFAALKGFEEALKNTEYNFKVEEENETYVDCDTYIDMDDIYTEDSVELEKGHQNDGHRILKY